MLQLTSVDFQGFRVTVGKSARHECDMEGEKIVVDNIRRFPVKHHQRVLNRRGKGSLSCIISDRWMKFGQPSWDHPDLGIPIRVDVLKDYAGADGRKTHRFFELVIKLDDLRALLAHLESQR